MFCKCRVFLLVTKLENCKPPKVTNCTDFMEYDEKNKKGTAAAVKTETNWMNLDVSFHQ